MSDNTKTKKHSIEIPPAVDILLCLAALLITSVYYYGYRALLVTVISVLTCYATDLLCIFLRKQKYIFKNISPVIIGFVLALLMPASVSYGVLVVTCVITIVIGKQIFGGIDNPVFAPVAVGYAISSICWKAVVLMYTVPIPLSQLSFASKITEEQSHSLTYFINQGTIPFVSRYDIFLGRFAGPMGTTHLLILAVCALALMLRKIVPWQTVIAAVATLVAGSLIFPANYISSSFDLVLFELATGASLYILLFVACDRSLVPKTATGKTLYGIIIALLTIVFRKYALVEQGMIFAVIIADVLIDSLDSAHKVALSIGNSMKKWPRYIGMFFLFIIKAVAKGVAFIVRKIAKSDVSTQKASVSEVSAEGQSDVIDAEEKQKSEQISKKSKKKKPEPLKETEQETKAIVIEEPQKPEQISKKSKKKKPVPLKETEQETKAIVTEEPQKLEQIAKKSKKKKPEPLGTAEQETKTVVTEEPAEPEQISKKSKKKKPEPLEVTEQETKTVVTEEPQKREVVPSRVVPKSVMAGKRTRTKKPPVTVAVKAAQPEVNKTEVTPAPQHTPRKRMSELETHKPVREEIQLKLFDVQPEPVKKRSYNRKPKAEQPVAEVTQIENQLEFKQSEGNNQGNNDYNAVLESQPRRRRHSETVQQPQKAEPDNATSSDDSINEILKQQPKKRTYNKKPKAVESEKNKELVTSAAGKEDK